MRTLLLTNFLNLATAKTCFDKHFTTLSTWTSKEKFLFKWMPKYFTESEFFNFSFWSRKSVIGSQNLMISFFNIQIQTITSDPLLQANSVATNVSVNQSFGSVHKCCIIRKQKHKRKHVQILATTWENCFYILGREGREIFFVAHRYWLLWNLTTLHRWTQPVASSRNNCDFPVSQSSNHGKQYRILY